MNGTGNGSSTESRQGLLLVALLACALGVACAERKQDETGDGDRVVARVGETAITEREVTERFMVYPLSYRMALQAPGGGGMEPFLKDLADRLRLKKEAERLGLDKDKEGLIRQEMAREAIYRDLVYRKLVFDKVVHPDEIREYYESHLQDYQIPAMIHARQIVVTPVAEGPDVNSQGDDAQTPAEAKAKMDFIQDQLREGIPFDEVASKYSEDSSAHRGGDLGWAARGKYNSEIEKVLWKLQPGERSPVIEVDEAYYILECLGRTEAQQLPLADVKDDVIQKLSQIHASELMAERKRLIEGLRERYPLQIAPGGLEGLEVP